MFTGIITDIGRVRRVQATGAGSGTGEGRRFEIETLYRADDIDIGASIACCGICMTVVAKGQDGKANWFAIEASAESLSKTTMGTWAQGRRINLERAMRLGDELGGHIVSGHMDGVGEIVERTPDGDSVRFAVRVPDELAKYIAPKGSITIDGVSLTVNETSTDRKRGSIFGVNIIPHTRNATIIGSYKTGDKVNLEIDMLARYVARLLEKE